MNKKKNLLNLFTQDSSYNFHLIKTEDPNGHLVYIMRNGSILEADSLEFAPTIIVEELLKECTITFEKFAPAIFFTDEINVEKLKYELSEKMGEDLDFSNFIESIKDEYRILEIKDSLLYKKDPEAYDNAKKAEHEEHQKELWDKAVEQLTDKKKNREDMILAYNNDIIRLLKEYLRDVIEYEKRDFKLNSEIEKVIHNLIDQESWIKIDEKPFICKIEIISLEQNKINLFLTDNINTYTATLRFDKANLITENVVKIENENVSSIKYMTDYEVLAFLYDIDLTSIPEWNFKNHTDRFQYIIDYLAPIFKIEIDSEKKELIDKIVKSQKKSDEDDFEDEESDEEESDSDDDENGNKIKINTLTPDKYYFNVCMPDPNDPIDELNTPIIALTSVTFFNKNGHLDDRLGGHNIGKHIKKALKNAGIDYRELAEAMWSVDDHTRTEKDIIDSMVKEGFIYNTKITG